VSFEVEPYFALLRPGEVSRGNGRPPVANPRPLFLGRYLKVSRAPAVAHRFGLTYEEVRNCGEFTSCCGGPAESVSPALNREILHRRLRAQGQRRPGGHLLPHLSGQPAQAGLPVEDLASLLTALVSLRTR